MKTGLKVALILAAAAWVYFPAWHGEWLWDDIEEMVQNPVLRDPHALPRIWLAPTGMDYYPLKTTVQWLVWQLGGGTVAFHLLNTALHALAALLVWRLFSKLGLRQAWWGGLLFAVDPLCVESVAWMTELKNTLSLPLLLLAACAYIDFDNANRVSAQTPKKVERADPSALAGHRPAPLPYIFALICFTLSLFAKTAGVMFPLALLLYAWWKRGRIAGRDVVAAVPFFTVSLLLGLITFAMQSHRSIGDAVIVTGGWLSRFAAAGLIAAFYLCKAAFATVPLPMYPRWSVDPVHWAQFLPWAVLAAAGFWLARGRSTRTRAIVFGLGFFFLNLVPVLGFTPISHMRFSWTMDHLAYVSLIGLIGLGVGGLDLLPRRAGMLAAAIAIVLAAESHAYARLYAHSVDLWSYTIERNPRAWLAQYNLGVAEEHLGRQRDALARYEAATKLNPAYPEAHLNYGTMLAREGRPEEAIAQYRLGLRYRSDYPEAENNLSVLLLNAGAVDEAILHGERAVKLRPDYAEAHLDLGNALVRRRERRAEAVAHFREALRLRPGYADAHNGLGVVLAYTGHLPQAIAEFRTAVALDPNLVSARDNLRRLQAASGSLP